MALAGSIDQRVWLSRYPSGVRHDIEIPNKRLDELFDESARSNAKKTAMIFLGTHLSFRTLWEHVSCIGSSLMQLGVRKGDRVALLLPNSPQFVASYFGSLKAGATVTPMNPLFTPREIASQAQEAEASTIFTLDLFYEKVREAGFPFKNIIVTNIADYFPVLKRVLGKTLRKIPTAPIPAGKGVHQFRQLLIDRSSNPRWPTIDPSRDIACLQFTGGTTGKPKGVLLTHGNIVADIHQIHEMLKGSIRDGEETIVALLPFFHIYGQTVLLGKGLCFGNTLLTFPRLEMERFLADLERHRATILPGVPTLFNAMSKHPRISRYNLSSLHLVISGADILPVEVAREFEKVFNRRIVEGYGLTETSPVTHITPPDGVRYGSFGVPVPSTDAAIIDPEALLPVPPGQVGELIISGPQVMQGYLGGQESDVFVEYAGKRWFRTGDLAKMDEEGYFYFVERKKDLIKHKGYSVFPAEVESVLYEHASVAEAAVVGVPDPAVGERIVAAVVLVPELKSEIGEEDLLHHCAERLAEYKRPDKIILLEEMPKTAVGKVLRRAVRDRLLTA